MHGAGKFTYMNGWFLLESVGNYAVHGSYGYRESQLLTKTLFDTIASWWFLDGNLIWRRNDLADHHIAFFLRCELKRKSGVYCNAVGAMQCQGSAFFFARKLIYIYAGQPHACRSFGLKGCIGVRGVL